MCIRDSYEGWPDSQIQSCMSNNKIVKMHWILLGYSLVVWSGGQVQATVWQPVPVRVLAKCLLIRQLPSLYSHSIEFNNATMQQCIHMHTYVWIYTGLYTCMAVSYTHLDVYKRQAMTHVNNFFKWILCCDWVMFGLILNNTIYCTGINAAIENHPCALQCIV